MEFGYDFWVFIVRWLHVLSGVMWIGLLWYFNFVQTPTVPTIPEDWRPAIPKHIMPEALFLVSLGGGFHSCLGLDPGLDEWLSQPITRAWSY